MNKKQEKVLVAALCGLVITAAGAFAVQPAMAAGYDVDQLAKVTDVARWDNLNVRKWPASYSQKVGAFAPGDHVWVERCIEAETGAERLGHLILHGFSCRPPSHAQLTFPVLRCLQDSLDRSFIYGRQSHSRRNRQGQLG